MVLTLHTGFHVSGWKSDMLRHSLVFTLNRPEGVSMRTLGGWGTGQQPTPHQHPHPHPLNASGGTQGGGAEEPRRPDPHTKAGPARNGGTTHD